MKLWNDKTFELGQCGAITLHISDDRKRLLIEFATDAKGLDKSALNGFIEALVKARERMDR